MPAGELFLRMHEGITPVNGSLVDGWVDTYKQWGMSLTDTALSSLLTPAPNKAAVENKSRLEHGKRIVRDTAYVRKDERDISLEMHITADSREQFWDRYARFCSEVLDHGFMEMRNAYVPALVFRLTYMSCNQFSEFDGMLAKFTLRLNEPNPHDRNIEGE